MIGEEKKKRGGVEEREERKREKEGEKEKIESVQVVFDLDFKFHSQ